MGRRRRGRQTTISQSWKRTIRGEENDKNIYLPATLASMILSSVLEEKAEEEEADPLLGNCTRRVVGSIW